MTEILKNLHIDPSRLEQYIEMLGPIGLQAGGVIIRPVYSTAWVQARKQLAGWMSAAGLEVREDAVGNLFGRLRGTIDDTRTILTGSHIYSVQLCLRFDEAFAIISAFYSSQTLP